MKRIDISKLRKNVGLHFQVGLICSLSFTIMALNWTSYANNTFEDLMVEADLDEDIVEVVRTVYEKPKPLPPPKPEINELIEEVDTPDFVEEQPPEEIPIEIPEGKKVKLVDVIKPISKPVKAPPPPVQAPPEPELPVVDEIFKVVEEMPRFSVCEGMTTRQEKTQCSTNALMKFIYKNIRYPALAKENRIEGSAVVTFVIDKDGTVTAPEILRDIGGGCGKEILRVVRLMPKWIPGMQRGRKVKVQFTLPVNFKFE